MNNFRKYRSLFALPILALPLLAGCQAEDDGDSGLFTPTPSPTPVVVQYVQIERLARPAINEGLIVTNAYLNAFNAIPPSADLTAAAAAVVTEAVAVLEAVDQLDGVQNVDSNAIATAFFPDVMRIDTTIAIAPSVTGYTSGASVTKGILLGGRKIEDDVVDITLTVLVGAAVGDNVRYAGYVGNASQPGHKLLHGQSVAGGAATFPFLASPN